MRGADWIIEWWSWIVPTTLQATLLLALVWALDRVLVRRAWPQLLTLCWLLALARFFLPPELRSPWSITSGIGAPTLAAAKLSLDANWLSTAFVVWLAGLVALIVVRSVRRVRLEARVEFLAPSREWLRAIDGYYNGEED